MDCAGRELSWPGAAVFVFQDIVAAGNIDQINDYTVADDQIELHASAFTGLVPGAFTTMPMARRHWVVTASFIKPRQGSCGLTQTAMAQVRFADPAGGLAMLATEFSVV